MPFLVADRFYMCSKNSCKSTKLKKILALISKFSVYFQARHSVCHTCRGYELRLHACLSCVYFGCYDDNHIQEHAYKNEHWLGEQKNNNFKMVF